MRAAYYTSSKNIQTLLVTLPNHNQSVGDALLPEMIDSVNRDDPYNGRLAVTALKSMKGRAKAAIPVLSANLLRLEAQSAKDKFSTQWIRQELKDAIDEISRY